MNNSAITGVILAGGKNSRMGSDKGMLEVEGKKIVDRIIGVMKPLVREVIIISNGINYDNFGYAVYKDILKDAGPMGGIHAALQYSKTDKILVVSCDMPFISKEILSVVLKESNKGEIVIPEHGGMLEPLCAIYSRSCTGKLEELLKEGNWRMQDSLKYFKVKQVNFPDHELPDHYFLNVNTPAEYNSIK